MIYNIKNVINKYICTVCETWESITFIEEVYNEKIKSFDVINFMFIETEQFQDFNVGGFEREILAKIGIPWTFNVRAVGNYYCKNCAIPFIRTNLKNFCQLSEQEIENFIDFKMFKLSKKRIIELSEQNVKIEKESNILANKLIEIAAKSEKKANEFSKKLEEIEIEIECKICMENNVNSVFLPCNHSICCFECALLLDNCPNCRKVIDTARKIFK